MATSYSPSIVRSGLVLYIDPENERSFPGSPITNYFYLTNPRIDSSYAPYVRTASGTWPQKHPDAITVYDVNGNNISDYSNTGVADWTNVYHAIWTYDYTLKKPVVTIRNHDAGTWKAKYFFGASMNFSALGMTVGSQYTISWLQWTDDINRAANVGLYTRDNSNVQSFWDGLSANSTTSRNTRVGTWQRVFHTFTVSASRNLSDTSTLLYMYGYEYGTGTLKISDVQIELFSTPSNFSYNQTRGSTVATGGGTVDLSNSSNNGQIVNNVRQTITTPKSFVFNGTNNHISVADNTSLDIVGDKTLMCWVYLSSDTSCGIVGKSEGTVFGMALGYGWQHSGVSNGFMALAWNSSNTPFIVKDASRDLNKWNFLVARQSGGTRYIDVYDAIGVRSSSIAGVGTHSWDNNFPFMIGNANNGANSVPANTRIGAVMAYNRSLSDAEVRQNFNTLRGRYGL